MKDHSKNVIITGVSGGMGSATARMFTERGYTVFGLDIKEAKAIPGLKFHKTDLTDMRSVEEAYRKISSEIDNISCIINMAGIYNLDSLVEISEEEYLRIFNINLFSLYRVNKTFLPLLSKGGRIMITSSELAPLDPLPFTGLYALTKSAAEKYAFSLRMELQLLGIKVIVLRPGAVDTELLNVSKDRLDAFCDGTKLYPVNSARFRQIVDSVESRSIPPQKIAAVALRAFEAKRPHYIYRINRNPLLLILNLMPDVFQTWVIRKILSE